MPTLLQRLKAVEAALEGPERFRDMRLDVRAADGVPVLVAGGRWDKTFNRFLDPATEGDAETAVVIEAQESQLEFVRWFAEWLQAFREGYPRETQMAMLAGDRRGGKSFALLIAVLCTLLDIPVTSNGTPLIAWLVARSYRERFELEQWILNRIPAAWYHHQAAPEHQFQFVHGPTLRLLSADDPDTLKQGRADIVGVNEPQKMQARALANIVLGVSDLGGLTVLAANPPSGSDSRGEWMFDVKEALDDEQVAQKQGKRVESLGVKYFHVDSKKNKAIDQLARKRAGKLAATIDPTIQAGDVEGSWRRPVERALFEFDKHRHLHPCPDVFPGFPDMTREIARDRGEWGDFGYVAGVDFDWKPHIVAVIYRVFGSLEDPTFYAIDEFAGEKRWTIQRWIEEFADWGTSKGRNYTPGSLLLIGDASSSRRSQFDDPKTRGDDRTAFEIIEANAVEGAHWTIIPPQDHRGKTGKARNPNVDERLDLANDLLRRDRWKIDPTRCPWLAECAREATTERKTGRRKLKHDQFSHAIDAATYPLWRLAPRADGFKPSAGQARFAKPRRPSTW